MAFFPFYFKRVPIALPRTTSTVFIGLLLFAVDLLIAIIITSINIHTHTYKYLHFSLLSIRYSRGTAKQRGC